MVWVEDFPGAGAHFGEGDTKFHSIQAARQLAKEPPYSPFLDLAEWEMAQWMMMSNMSQEDKDQYLKLKAVSTYSVLQVRN
jgi:hypothetical protein